MRRLAAAAAFLATLAGCGGDDADKPRLVVSAATSLKGAFQDYGPNFNDADVKLSFAGSDELAAQIRQGVKPDVYAAANAKLPQALFEQGLVEKPVAFASNELVIAAPAGNQPTLTDLGKPGVDVVIGSASVPVGAYTRQVLARLPCCSGRQILKNVRSTEPDVGGIIGKLLQGAADAGFVYATDVKATGGKLMAIEIDPRLRPEITYEAAVVKDAEHRAEARAFIGGLTKGDGRRALMRAGFGVP